MSALADLPGISRVLLVVLLTLISLITAIVLYAQIGCVRGKPFENRAPMPFITPSDIHRWRHEWRKNKGSDLKLWGNETRPGG